MRRRHDNILPMRTLFMMFFNPSLRTRNSFETGIFELGGHANFLVPEATRLPTLEGEDQGYGSERISDVARVLSRMGACIAIRILGDKVNWEYDKSLRIRYWNCGENQNNAVEQTDTGTSDFSNFTFTDKDDQ